MFDRALLDRMIEFLNIELPVELTFTTKGNSKIDAEYSPVYRETKAGINLKKHKIKVFGNTWDRSLDTLIAHELIHAWQEEQGIAEFHGPLFRQEAKAIGKEFGLTDVYLPDCDEE